MSLLVGPEGRRDDAFTAVDSVETLSLNEGAVLVPLEVVDQALGDRRNAPVGLALDGAAPVSAAEPYLGQVQLISVRFPSFSDGRGFTLAKRLRRAGFSGTLRASGPLIADQFAEALACGFDEVWLPAEMAARQPLEQWMAARTIVTEHYQTGYGEDRSILQKRLAARETQDR